MFKKVLLGLLAAVAVFAVVVALQSPDFRVERSVTVAAPPAAVFEQVNDFHMWEAWSPWAKIDPAMTASYEGPSAGVGAVYRWAGNNEVGAGSMTITESRPGEYVGIDLHFLKPFEGTNRSEFALKPDGDKTLVTWTMTGRKNFVTKAVGLVLGIDKMVGDQFDAGLAKLKTVAETPAAK